MTPGKATTPRPEQPACDLRQSEQGVTSSFEYWLGRVLPMTVGLHKSCARKSGVELGVWSRECCMWDHYRTGRSAVLALDVLNPGTSVGPRDVMPHWR